MTSALHLACESRGLGETKIGVAGWAYKDWQGIVYPRSLGGVERLEYLSRFFDLVEINTSFYGPIKPAVAASWCRAVETNPKFIFTAKLTRAFTHSPNAVFEPTSAATIRPAPGDERETKAGFDALAGERRLGALLMQFPISFKRGDENQRYVESLAARFGAYPLALEVRHASWNNEEVLAWLTGLGVGICNIDQPLIGRAVPPGARATSSIGYVRLHGRNYRQWFAESTNVRDRYDFLYSTKELEPWTERIQAVGARTEHTFVVANNHNLGKAAVNALELIALLDRRKVEAPPELMEHYPVLRELAARR